MSSLNAKFQNYFKRLESFENWTGKVEPELLARAGLYLAGDGHTTCYSCQEQVVICNETVNPWIVHMTRNPFCPHILINRKSIHNVEIKDRATSSESMKFYDLTIYDKFSYEDVKDALEHFMQESKYTPSTIT